MEQTMTNNQEIAPEEVSVEAQELVAADVADNQIQSKPEQEVEEIDSANASTPSKPTARTIARRDEPMPNPLIEDPYEWERCTITLIYARLPDNTVSISVYNHKDDPLVKTFAATEVPLPEKISGMMEKLRAIWPDSTISATVVLIPKPAGESVRVAVISLRAGSGTPIVQTGIESDLEFPAQIDCMLEELKALLPARALKRLEKDAKNKAIPASKQGAKTASKVAPKQTPVPTAAVNKTQMSLF